ncbi:hypothetical protein [Spirosoma radiotolerans]|uniref:hypothetical protein n=1 Tax=Spirosoma radiotolerans TaxID=1379870 RepID=UPI0011DE4475|nr:hypothetical protein [Spirosoma radiotolerans]
MKTTLNHTLAIVAFFVSTLVAQAQVKIGNVPTSINGGSLLELESTNKGLLMPRISLTNTTTWGLAGTPAAGMHVYNTNTAITSTNTSYPTLAAKIGEYYWDGTGWVALAPVGVQDAPVLFSVSNVGNQVAAATTTPKADYGIKHYDKNNVFDLSSDSFTVPANGTGVYQFSTVFGTIQATYAQGLYVGLYINGTLVRTIAIANCQANAAGIAGGGTIIHPLTAGDVVDIRFLPSLQAGQTLTFFISNLSVAFLSK